MEPAGLSRITLKLLQFEPAASRVQGKRSTGLNHSPIRLCFMVCKNLFKFSVQIKVLLLFCFRNF